VIRTIGPVGFGTRKFPLAPDRGFPYQRQCWACGCGRLLPEPP
jgi:hypothetical protein